MKIPCIPCCQQSSENFIYTFTEMQICKLGLAGLIQSKSFVCPNEMVIEVDVPTVHRHHPSPPLQSFHRGEQVELN